MPPWGGPCFCYAAGFVTKQDEKITRYTSFWSEWSDWSKCNATCGPSFTVSRRVCISKGKKTCRGRNEKWKPCSTVPCPIDGGWSPWGNWTSCSVTCEKGRQTRSRTCTNPAPQFGGKDCQGQLESARSCMDKEHCPIHGGWGEWSRHWSACSLTCGLGVRTRERKCDSPKPQYGGRPCNETQKQEERHCRERKCEPDTSFWSEWSDWSKCNATCGPSFTVSRRVCISKGKKTCRGRNEKWKPCSTVPCPIDGGWSPWGNWTSCSVTCEKGRQTRSRTCTNPAPQFGGKDCQGQLESARSCMDKEHCPIHGGWGEWSRHWSACSLTCGLGVRTRERKCDSPKPQYGGRPCNETQKQEERHCRERKCEPETSFWSEWSDWSKCNATCGPSFTVNRRVCISKGKKTCRGRNEKWKPCSTVPCPIDGGWSPWGNWTSCSVTCEKGRQTRSRTCTNPAPQFGGKDCQGPLESARSCMDKEHCPIHGGWGEWSRHWSACSLTCGLGVRTRERKCDSPKPQYGGRPCNETQKQEERHCRERKCEPETSFWSEWSDWSKCNATCGPSFTVSRRVCISKGKKTCRGRNEKWKPCSTVPCPIDGGWSPWGNWTSCSVTCEKGRQTRSRTCTNPAPQFGGKDCQGQLESARSCMDKEHCPIHGGWGEWSRHWSACSLTCGLGVRTRERKCDSPKPQYGGRPCNETQKQEERHCRERKCEPGLFELFYI
ncbi:coadhesin-like [Oculina patagonica]